MLLGRQQRLEKQVAIILATGTIPPARRLGHQIEAQRRHGARIDAIVHPEQADHLERDGAHWHQGAEVDPTGEELLAGANPGQRALQMITQHRQRQRILIAGLLQLIAQLTQRLTDQLQLRLPLLVGLVELQQQLIDEAAPLADRAGQRQLVAQPAQTIEEVAQPPQSRRILPLDLAVGQNIGHRLIAGHRKTQQHAFDPVLPGVGRHLVEGEPLRIAAVQPPTDARFADPALHLLQIRLLEPLGRQHLGHRQQAQQLGGAAAQIRQMQERQEALQQRALLGRRAVGDGEGNVALGSGRTKHRLDEGAVAVDVGHHHHHIPRLESRIGGKARQQGVVQHLHLAHRAVAGMDDQGLIFRGQEVFFALPAAILEIQNVRLQQVQQVVRLDLDEGIELVRLQIHQQGVVIPPLLAHGDQQRVALGHVTGIGEEAIQAGRVSHQRLLRPRDQRGIQLGTAACQQLLQPPLVHAPGLDEIAPVVTAGVGQHQMHVGMVAQRLQRPQVVRRQ